MGKDTLRVQSFINVMDNNECCVTDGGVYDVLEILANGDVCIRGAYGKSTVLSSDEYEVFVDKPEMTTYSSGAVRETKIGKGKQHYLFVGFPFTLTELAKHMDNPLGRNWEEGLPVSCYADATIRHLLGFLAGDSEPHHLRAAIWNLMCMSETVHRIEMGQLPAELDDVDRSKRSEIVYGED